MIFQYIRYVLESIHQISLLLVTGTKPSKRRYEINTRIDGKTVVITGASMGIGKFTAQELYKIGGRIIIADINTDAAEEAAEEIRKNVSSCHPESQAGELVIKKLDLTSIESIRNFARDILESERQINILINNAGVIVGEYCATESGFERQFMTNYLGHFYLTLLLLPKILRSTPSRIVSVSSSAHKSAQIHWGDLNLKRNYHWWTAYSQSKLAIVLFTRELDRRLKDTGVSVYCVNPGPTITTIGQSMYNNRLGFDWTPVVIFLVKAVDKIFHFSKTLEEAAATGLYCALDTSLADESGFYYDNCAREEVSERALNDQDARRMWNTSLKMLDLEDFDFKQNQTVS